MRAIAGQPSDGKEKTAVLPDEEPLLNRKLGFAPSASPLPCRPVPAVHSPAALRPLSRTNTDSIPAGAPFAAALVPAEHPTDPLHPFTAPDAAAAGLGPTVALPQTIAHRGYTSEYPENTMEAFRAAVAVGAHALETDVHLSRDGVVVLSHDPTLRRCFGRRDKIADLDWAELATLRTLRPPHSPMPRLLDLLAFLATEPAAARTWVLLDLKRSDDPAELVRRVADTIAAAHHPGGPPPWADRLALGCWDARYMRLCRAHLPGFPLVYIGWSIAYARHLLRYEGVHFNLQQRVLVGPWGRHFVRQAQARGRRVLVWTVNHEEWMEWSIRRGVDGVITDDPKLFLDVCRRWDDEAARAVPAGRPVLGRTARETTPSRWAKLYAEVALFQVLSMLFGIAMRIALGPERTRIQSALNDKR